MKRKMQTHKKRQKPVNSYVISLDTIKEMNDQIRETHKTGLEHGMSLCVDKGQNTVKTGYKSVGTEMGISVSERCKSKKQKYVGSFHTHPDDSEAASSAQDLFSQCLKISNLDCIGKNTKGEIVCYAKKTKGSSCLGDAKPVKDIEDMFHQIPSESLPLIKEDLYEEVDNIARKHFNLHKIQ